MVAWRHPDLGLIQWIPDKLQPRKVWKHFHDPAEHWERISPLSPNDVLPEVMEVVGLDPRSIRDLPEMNSDRWRPVAKLLQKHHSKGYGPAYYVQMKDEQTVWARSASKRMCYRATTPDAVSVIVKLDSPSWVVTAFRPHPPTRGVEWNEDDFREHARWVFAKETRMALNDDQSIKVLAEKLSRCLSVTGKDPATLWRLASSLSWASLTGPAPELAELFHKAEQRWRETDDSAKQRLEEALDWDGTLDAISAGLKDDRSEEFEISLSSAEELVAVGEQLGSREKLDSFLAQTGELVAWVPSEWAHLAEAAKQRRAMPGVATSAIGRLWDAVEDALSGALVRETAPKRRPAATLVDELLPAPGWLDRLEKKIAAFAARGGEGLSDLAAQLLGSLQVSQPSPVMGGTEAGKQQTWEVQSEPPETAGRRARLFVVDADYPRGYEVTKEWLSAAVSVIWQLEKPGQEAVLVVVVDEQPIEDALLDDILAAEPSPSRRVEFRKISRPR